MNKERISATWCNLFGLGLQADSSTDENPRRNPEPCLGRITRENVWSSEKQQLLTLRCRCIPMVQAAESRQGLNLAFGSRADLL
jgi:hypothetical protein